MFDLSEKIEGIAPLPGFARLRDEPASFAFIPLLGFEGTRFSYFISELEPPGQQIIPIIGLPGFRSEYPFTTYFANRAPLRDTRAWKKVRYAAADCPFETYDVLRLLRDENNGQLMKIAPIGTKPQALGAILFALHYPDDVELVYDHPIRKARRTSGASRLHVYCVTPLLESRL